MVHKVLDSLSAAVMVGHWVLQPENGELPGTMLEILDAVDTEIAGVQSEQVTLGDRETLVHFLVDRTGAV